MESMLVMEICLRRSSLVLVLALLFLVIGNSADGQRKCCLTDTTSTEHVCPFDSSSFTFAGEPLEQAKCLLRPVKIRGHLDPPLEHLPDPLEELIGKRVSMELETLRRYLSTHHIDESEIGGQLRKPLSPVDSTNRQGKSAIYFVIHDTSTPNYVNAFPANINNPAWSGNSFRNINRNITHVYVNRLGQSITVVDFERVLPLTNFGTKFACCQGERRKGRFLHIELVQPRHCDPTHGRCVPYRPRSDKADHSSNDNIAPSPGFTKAQLDRLALIYVAASVRKGEWLIPSFHAPMDATIKNAHDDPQNFDLADWADSLTRLLAELSRL
jgi:hypothetical protein